MFVCAPQNTMLRHTENCSGEIEEENGTPAPKKARRGRKRKMQTRRDDDDTGIVYVVTLKICARAPSRTQLISVVVVLFCNLLVSLRCHL